MNDTRRKKLNLEGFIKYSFTLVEFGGEERRKIPCEVTENESWKANKLMTPEGNMNPQPVKMIIILKERMNSSKT